MDAEGYRREVGARYADRLPELERRLESEAAVAGVTFEGSLPGRGPVIEVEGSASRAEALLPGTVIATGVASDYFELLGGAIRAGRGFRVSDAGESGTAVVVNEAFVRGVLDGGPALGRRVRFQAREEAGLESGEVVAGRWLEIVGVVQNLQASPFDREVAPSIVYHAVTPAELPSPELLVRVRGGDTGGFAPRLRQITTALDPDLRLGSVSNLARMRNARYLAVAVTIILTSLTTVLLLSAAGIHALMSLTVTRRRKEIGIRAALGARPARLVASIFSRTTWQLGLGGIIGTIFGGVLLVGTGMAGRQAAIFLGVVVMLMVTAGLAAAMGPARRGLRVQPMDALRED
jgi:hypothetical protein